MINKLLLLKTIREWKEEATKLKLKAMEEERYGAANYMMGKEQAYKEIIDLLEQLKINQIPFKLD